MRSLKQVIEPGYEPEKLGEKVVAAVLNNDLYVIPYAEFREPLIELHKRVLAALPDPKDDSGMESFAWQPCASGWKNGATNANLSIEQRCVREFPRVPAS